MTQQPDLRSIVAAAVNLAAAGNNDEALRVLDTAGREGQAHPIVRNVAGDIYLKLGRKREALKAFEIAVRNAPDYPEAHCNRGVALQQLGRLEEAVAALTEAGFVAKRFDWSINLKGRSKVSVQISTEDYYWDFPTRSVPADIHGILMRVASREDTLGGKLQAYADTQCRPSKRQKDLLDIARLVEAHPDLQARVPAVVLERLTR